MNMDIVPEVHGSQFFINKVLTLCVCPLQMLPRVSNYHVDVIDIRQRCMCAALVELWFGIEHTELLCKHLLTNDHLSPIVAFPIK